jgi:hypothetical protein
LKLVDLGPRWVGAGGEGIRNADGSPVPERRGVGVSFDCPCGGCGTRAFIPFNNPLDGHGPHDPSRNRWDRAGDTFETLTLTPSIQRVGGCAWHGYITQGEIVPA